MQDCSSKGPVERLKIEESDRVIDGRGSGEDREKQSLDNRY